MHGCQVLNERMPQSQSISDPMRLLNIMDMDQSEGIDINEFFETFRLVDAADGKVDGALEVIHTDAP